MMDCHPEPARTKAEALLGGQGEKAFDTIEKNGIKKMIYQARPGSRAKNMRAFVPSCLLRFLLRCRTFVRS